MTNEYNDLWELDRPVLVTLVTELRADLSAAQAALTQAERERDEAVSKIREHAEHVNYYGALYSQTELERRNIDEQREFYKDELAKAQTCADEMAALAWKWKYKADCQRATIRALVVAARVSRLAAVGFAFIAGVGPRRVHDEIRFGIKQAKQAERGQAGDEQS